MAAQLVRSVSQVKTLARLLRQHLRRDKGFRPLTAVHSCPHIFSELHLDMLTFFRSFFKSKVGVVVTLAFLALIALAFASSDVANTGTFGGVAGGDRVALVGDSKIGSADLVRSANSALEQVRQDNPTISMPAFIEQGALNDVLDQMIDRFAIGGFGEKYGMRAGDNLINSEIIAIPAFRGTDGNFSEETYRQVISSRGLTDSMVRQDLGAGLLAKQVLVPASFGATIPDKLVSRYAALLKETRKGAIAIIPSGAFAPSGNPTDPQLQSYYTAHRSDYIRPERRVIRYTSFGEQAVATSVEPTAQEVAARYQRERAQYASGEKRRFSQLIVPTRQAAKSIADRVKAGGSFETAANEAGLALAKLGPITTEAMSAQTSQAVSQAAFAASQGSIAEPARSGLGWHVIRVDGIEKIAGKTLAQATAEITTALREEKRRSALSDLSASVEERLDSGEALGDIARELKLTIETTQPLVANGQVYGAQGQTAPEVLNPILKTAFQMEEGEPQLAEVEPGKTFLIFEVSNVTSSAAAPLKEIRDDVIFAWRRAQGSESARQAADRILKRVSGGSTLAAALAAEKRPLPPVDSINFSRDQLAAAGRVPPPLALMFSMAKGTTKKLAAPQDGGWFIVALDNITPGSIAAADPAFQQAKRELGQAIGREYADGLRVAMREELGVERNETAISAVRKQLSGER